MLTRSDSVDPYEWIDAYIERRYGVSGDAAKNAKAAWKLLLDHVYVPGTDYVERGTVLCTRPCLRLRGTGPCDSFEIHYDNSIMLQIIDLLRETDSETEGYLYDMNDFCRQLLSNYAQKLYAEVSTAYIERRYDDFQSTLARFRRAARRYRPHARRTSRMDYSKVDSGRARTRNDRRRA